MVQQVNGQIPQEGGGGDIGSFDFQFMTAGDPEVEKLEKAELIQKNLTPEEIEKLKQLMPYVFDYFELMHKMETGEYPPEPTDEVMNEMAGFDLKKGSVNGQGMPESGQRDGRVPQSMENQQSMPPRPVEGQMPQNAPEMMSGGGIVDRFDPEGKGYDEETYRRIGSPKFFDERTQEMHGPSASPISELIEKGVLTEEDVKKYNLPMEGSLLLKGMGYETTPLELEAIKGKYEYKKVPTPLGERYIAFPINNMATGGVAAGPVGVINQSGADDSGVADDVPAESDGFVINAAAVRKVGLRKINDMIQKAIKYAQEQGIELDFGKTPVDAEKILVSNGEVVIPDVLARIIGYDELEAINALGAEETDEIIEEEEQSEKPVQEMPVALSKGGRSWQTYLDEYQGPFPDEDVQIRQTVLDTIEPYEDSELENLELYKRNYEDYWNPETEEKKRGSNRRYLDEERTERGPEWGEYLDEAYTDFEASNEVKEAIRRVLPAFKYELEKHDMYDAKQFDYWSQIESQGGKNRRSEDKRDYGTFQVHMPLLEKIFKSDEYFENFTKYYGPKATAVTGISPYFLRKLYLEDTESFKDLMVDDHATNLAVGLAGSLLPAVD